MLERKPEPQNERLGGARADFVAHLGRRVAELATTLRNLVDDPSSERLLGELKRRIHALGAGARLLRFAKLAEQIASCEELLGQIAERGSLDVSEATILTAAFERMPALAWGQTTADAAPPSRPAAAPTPTPSTDEPFAPAPSTATPNVARPAPQATAPAGGETRPLPRAPMPSTHDVETTWPGWPQSALVVGPAQLADALTNPIDDPASPAEESYLSSFEVERTEEIATALDLARALAPDVVVVDADDAKAARKLVEALLADPLTEPVPIVVVGRWSRPDDAAPFVALGVARALPKPVSPRRLREACAEATATYVRHESAREPLGKVTLDELGTRLAEELRRGLCDAAEAKGRSAKVDLGEGSEVLAAVWGAVARVRDLVTIQSRGGVRFTPTGPEGALPVAAWSGVHDAAPGSARSQALGDSRVAATSLEGVSILVADDDAAVTWFLAGVLRGAGATVHEAHDGLRALEVAHRVAPDLVISDIVMPGLDGFALCRALKRDLVLRDVPIILLSWKEDLLQRVRELGAAADGYMRKEASAAAIVLRVREVLRPRKRVVERLRSGGEVRGRLDGLTTRTLLSVACSHHPWSTLTVRDASFLYEVEIEEGRPVRATRTATDGTFQRGPSVLAALLGVGAGRFVVTPSSGHGPSTRQRADLAGGLSEQLAPPVAAARAAQRLLSGAQLVQVERVDIDGELIEAYVAATFEPARTLLRSLAAGASPRVLITSGQASARLLEDVLCDAAAHGAVRGVLGQGALDLLTPAIERELGVLSGLRLSMPPSALVDPLAEIHTLPAAATPPPLEAFEGGAAPVVSLDGAETTLEYDEAAPPSGERGGHAPTSLVPDDEAVGLWPFQRPLVGTTPPSMSPTPTPVSGEVPRSARPSTVTEVGESDLEDVASPSEDAAPVLAEPGPLAEPTPAPMAQREPTPAPPRTPTPAVAPRVALPGLALPPMTTLGSLTPPPVSPEVLETLVPSKSKSPTPTPAKAEKVAARRARDEAEAEASRPIPRPSAWAPQAPAEPPKAGWKPKVAWVVLAVASCVFAVAMRWSRQIPPPQLPPAETAPPAGEAAPAPTGAPTAMPETDETTSVQEMALRPEDKVGAGQGMLEVVAGASDSVFVDGKLLGTGPTVKLALAPRPQPYEVRVKLRGEDRVRFVSVKDGRLVRVRVAPPWSR